jgi:transmembrane sensor
MDKKQPSSECLAEAERWYAKLKAPDCSASDRVEFQRWQSAAEHAAAYDATERLWRSLGQLAGRPDFEQLSRQLLAASGRRAGGYGRYGIAIAASILIAALCGVAFLSRGYREVPTVVYSTKVGERATIKLADGSQLVLNYATELDVQLGKDVRRLTLHKGEALFNVAHDANRPFKVDAGGGEVTALGTRFEVRSEAKRVAITLLEGRVSVDRLQTKEHVELAPGDQVRFAETTAEMTRRTVDPEVVASWSTGRLRFRAMPLGEAIDEVNRYSSSKIHVSDPTLARIRISGTFEVGDTASVVGALEALLPIQATEKDGTILLAPR